MTPRGVSSRPQQEVFEVEPLSVEDEAVIDAAIPAPERVDRAAFGRFLKTDLYDVSGEYDLDQLTEAEKAWMTPRNIRPHLFFPDRDGQSVVDGVPLNGFEYKLIARSPKKLAETAFTNTLAVDDVSEDRLAQAERAGVHALEAKVVAMREHSSKLQDRREGIHELEKQARMPGFAHKTDEEMRLLLNHAWTEFKTMLEVVHVQRHWTDEQRHHAEAALINYLTQGPQRDRTKHWKEMLNLSSAYLSRRIQLFEGKIGQVDAILNPDTDEQT